MTLTEKPSPLVGEGGGGAVGRGKCEKKHKKYFYRTVLNTCPSFLNKAKKWSETKEKYRSDENLVEGGVFQPY